MKSIVFTPVIYRGEVGWRTLNFISLRASFTSSRFPVSFFFCSGPRKTYLSQEQFGTMEHSERGMFQLVPTVPRARKKAQ